MKKALIIGAALLLLATTASAQNVDSANHSDELFVEYEEDPEFPGGLEALHKFIEDNLQYPQIAAENCI